MNDKSRMQVLQRFCHLIDYESDVYVLKNILGYDIVQICLHKLKYQVNVLAIICSQSIIKLYYIRVLCLLQNFNFTVCALSISGMLKGVKDFFESVDFFGGFLLYFPDMTIGTGSYFFNDIKAPKYMTFDVSGIGL